MVIFKNTLFVLCLGLSISCKQDVISPEIIAEEAISLPFNFHPTSSNGVVYHHEGYSFSYVEDHEQSEWVAYALEKSDFPKNYYERPYFEVDDVVESKSAHWGNYKKSGYNKGHLCPAGDRKKTIELYEETFLMSNVSPQLYDFNSGIWNRLEQKTRYWAEKYNGVYVVSGGVLKGNLKTIGTENVSVPDYFYKVIMTKDKSKMIAFLVPHKNSDASLIDFSVSVDDIEKVTGIDFFPELNDKLENELEASSNYKKWIF